jgi:hypothetical protein
MADIKPLGSEKLNGDEKLKRILELTYFNQNNKKSSSVKPELVKESTTGGVFGIVKEKDGYYVKRGLNESSLDYIGGMFMKNKNKFSSYSEAFKRLELLKGQEELQEATKYVLKPSSPKSESPMSDPAANAPIPTPAEEPAPEAPAEEPAPEAPAEEPAPEAPVDGEDDASGKRSSYMAEVQKFAGKLGQELRDQHESMESDDIKYVLNMIISAVDLDKLEDEDIEDIAKKFERDENQDGEEAPSEEPAPEDEVPAEEPVDSELGEESDAMMDALENFINSSADFHEEINLADYADLEMDEEIQADFAEDVHVDFSEGDVIWSEETDSTEEPMDEEVELDLEEMKNEINNSIQTTLGKYFK